MALLTKWPVFLQNAFSNPAYVNQTNLNGKLRNKLGGPNRRLSKNLGVHGPPRPPLRIATDDEKGVKRSHTPQETATDCGYVGLQANVLTVGLFANKYRIFSNISRVFL